jgi:hypothetical protein
VLHRIGAVADLWLVRGSNRRTDGLPACDARPLLEFDARLALRPQHVPPDKSGNPAALPRREDMPVDDQRPAVYRQFMAAGKG